MVRDSDRREEARYARIVHRKPHVTGADVHLSRGPVFVHASQEPVPVCARGSDGYGDISSPVQSHNVTRNTLAHQSFSRKWNLLPSSCSVSAPCTPGYFVRPTVLCTRVYQRAVIRTKGRGEWRNELLPPPTDMPPPAARSKFVKPSGYGRDVN